MDAVAVIIGGGPAGAAAGRLLASWGHRVLILYRSSDRLRGLAESLPPSTVKLFAEIGVLDLVQRAGFYGSTGNTVCWGAEERRVETFGSRSEPGLQVFRPELDRLLIESAISAGADVRANASVRGVQLEDDGAVVEFERNGRWHRASCRFVLDCSGRAGVIGRRFRRHGHRMYALVGAWHTVDRWDLPDQTHTLVEAFDNGWAWSVPVSALVRQVGVMVEGVSPRAGRGQTLADAYRAVIARTSAHARLVSGASLQRAWACDASTYSAEVPGGPQFLLVGDAASFIDPLSSFGVKKALASGWIAALVVNTCLTHPERQAAANEFFADWEQDVCATHARRSRDFARQAHPRHRSPFWAVRANAVAADADPDTGVRVAFETIKDSADLDFELAAGTQFEKRPVIRGREIALEDAFANLTRGVRGIRFWENIDLIPLAEMACRHRHVPDLFDAYCRTNGPAPLPSVLGGLSLLVAKGILNKRNVSPC